MSVLAEIERKHQQLTAVRRDIHAHPELAFQEERTSALVAKRLSELGLEVHTGLGKTGVVGVLRKGTSKRSIGLRADMDALPMPEANRFAHRSQHPGKMHGCGHDGHTTMLLGAAEYLAQHGKFDGVVNFIFQPAEEGGNTGAKVMIDDGLFQRFPCDAIYGMHNQPGMPTGHFGFRSGPTMASSNRFDIVIDGVGGHAAQPHKSVDPIMIAVATVQSLQNLITRNKNPLDTAVLSITQIHAGDAYNVIPAQAVIRGTLRTYSTAVLDLLENNMRRIVTHLAEAHGARGELKFVRCSPSLTNWPKETEFVTALAEKLFGADRVERDTAPHTGSEDFSFYLEKVPGSYFFIGNGDGGHRAEAYQGMGPCELHNSSYDFNDELLPVGATFWVKLIETALAA